MIQDILRRAQRLLLSPAKEWDAINGDHADMADTYKSYVSPLVIFSALAGAIGSLMMGLSIWFVLRSLLLAVIIGVASVYLFSLIIDALAPTFGGQKNPGQAFKVAAYAPTAAWLASVFNIIPALSILAVLGVYSLYLLYVGLPKLMNCPADKALGYAAVIVACVIVLSVILTIIVVPLIVGLSVF
jgi:hypothetical protein